MKKIISLVLALTLAVFCFASCAKTEDTDKLAEVKKAGKLVIATSPDFEPFEFLDGTTPVGIEIELMQKICDKLGVKLEVTQVDFDSVLVGVNAGKYDCGVSGISVTPDREKNNLFTKPYCLAAQAIVVVEGSEIKSKSDLAGKSVSVQSATTAEEFCMSNGYDVKAYTANSDAEMALVQDKVNAWVIDDLTAKAMVDEYNADNETKLVILDDAMTTEPYAFAFKKGSDTLVAEIDKILVELVNDGTVEKLFEKYDAPYTKPEI